MPNDFDFPYDLSPEQDEPAGDPSFEDLASISPLTVIAKARKQAQNTPTPGREETIFADGYLAGLDFCRKTLASTTWVHVPGAEESDIEILEQMNGAMQRLEDAYEEAFGERPNADTPQELADAYEEVLT